jgi:sugar lactone lactonase YvrE
MRPFAILIALILLLPLATAADYALSGVITSKIVGTDKALKSPADVYADEATGRLFVSDTFDYAVQVYYLGNLTYLRTIGGDVVASSYESGLSQPVGMVVRNSYLYVADAGQNNIKQYTSDLALLATTTSGSQSAVYNLNGVTGVEVLPNGTTYIADTFNNRILIYDSKFKYIGEFGSYGSFGDDSLYYPQGLALSGSQLFIADAYNDRVKVVSLNGSFVNSIGTGAGDVVLHYPEDVYVALDGRIYVADTYNNRVVVFSAAGTPTSIIAGEYAGRNITQPRGVYADSKDNVYIADTGSNRVLVFKPTGLLPAIAANASSDIALAASEIAYFNSLASYASKLDGVIVEENSSSGYLELARTKYAAQDYAGAFIEASKARSRIAGARAALEAQLNTAINANLLKLYGRFATFDSDIYAGKLPLSTSSLRAKAEAVNASAADGDIPTAVADLASLIDASDAMDAQIKRSTTEAVVTKNELSNSIAQLIDQLGALKIHAADFGQQADTGQIDTELSQASALLSRNLTAASAKYANAQSDFNILNANIEARISLIVDANRTIQYAKQAAAEASNTSGAFGPADVKTSLDLINQAEQLLYAQPEQSKQLASRAIDEAHAAQARATSSRNGTATGIAAMFAIIVVAAGVVYYVYKQRRERVRAAMDGGRHRKEAHSAGETFHHPEASEDSNYSMQQPESHEAKYKPSKPSRTPSAPRTKKPAPRRRGK